MIKLANKWLTRVESKSGFLISIGFLFGGLVFNSTSYADQSKREPLKAWTKKAKIKSMPTKKSKYLKHVKINQKFDLVLVLHGMGRTSFSMKLMENRLEKQGYQVYNWNYNGWFKSLSKLTDETHTLLDSVESDKRVKNIYIVAHSMGNIVMRSALSEKDYPKVKRIVMLAPPNQGSAKADQLSSTVGKILLPMGELKRNKEKSGLGIAKVPRVEIGVLVGDQDPFVKAEDAVLPEAKELKVIKSYHTFIMNRAEVFEDVLHFFKHGQFSSPQENPE